MSKLAEFITGCLTVSNMALVVSSIIVNTTAKANSLPIEPTLEISRTASKNESHAFPELNGNGHALSWDGRILVNTQGSHPSLPFDTSHHEVHVVRPQNFKLSDTGKLVTTNALSKRHLWSVPEYIYRNIPVPPAGLDSIPVRHLNALTIAKDQDFPENPFRSDVQGNPQRSGKYETYRALIILQDYGLCVPMKSGCDPKAKVPYQFGTFKTQIVVRNPRTSMAEIESIRRITDITMMVAKNGQPIRGIEPTATIDGRLIIFQTAPAGAILFTFNEGTQNRPQWLSPLPISQLHAKRNDKVQIENGKTITFGDLYRIAQYPMRLPDGSPINDTARGGYPWVDLDGDDLMLTTVTNIDANGKKDATRAAQSIIGASTRGMLLHMDGGVNSDRYRRVRLFTSSWGRTPGKWAPTEMPAIFPISQKRNNYPIFASNASAYFEISLEESIEGNYDFYFPMNEPLKHHRGDYDYDLSKTQDVSGNFHIAQKSGNPLFSDDVYGCTENCDQNQEVRYSGKALYFKPQESLVVQNKSVTGHQLLTEGGLTLSFAIKIFREPGKFNFIAHKGSVFNVILEANRQVQFTVYDSEGQKRSGAFGSTLPLNEWVHLTFTYNGKNGLMKYFVNGVLSAEKNLGKGNLAINDTPFVIGPTASSGGGTLYALDQMALSAFERPLKDIERQVMGAERQPSKMSLPTGLNARELIFARGRALDPNLIDIGRHLFFDTRLSKTSTMACATCHEPARAWTDGLKTSTGLQGHSLKRNAPSILNMAFNNNFFHDGRAETLQAQVKAVILNKEEMDGSFNNISDIMATDAQYVDLLKGQAPNENLINSAIAEFMLSLTAGNSKHDRVMAKKDTFTEDEFLGHQLFNGRARCAECHSGSNFTDNSFHNLGFLNHEDQGRVEISRHRADRFKFKTPSLRNVELTAPYFHNGSAVSLEDVINLYSLGERLTDSVDPVVAPLNLDSKEQRAIVAYLKTLTGELPRVAIPIFTKIKVPKAPPTAKTCFFDGKKLVDRQTVTAYRSSIATTNSPCSSESRLCKNGELTGSFENAACAEPTAKTLTSSIVHPGFELKQNDFIYVGEKKPNTVLIMQGDGNLVLYVSAKPVWHSNTFGQDCRAGNCRAAFQHDGNLVVYNGTQVLWSSQTAISGSTLTISQVAPFLEIRKGLSLIWTTR